MTERKFTLVLPSDARLFGSAMAVGAGLTMGGVGAFCLLKIVLKLSTLAFGWGE